MQVILCFSSRRSTLHLDVKMQTWKKPLDITWELIALGLSQHAEKLICLVDLQINDCLELQQKSALSPWKHTCMNKWTGKCVECVSKSTHNSFGKEKKKENHISLKRHLVIWHDRMRSTSHHVRKRSRLYCWILTVIKYWVKTEVFA